MGRNRIRQAVGGMGLLLGTAGGALWRWKRRRLETLAARSELVATDRGVVEVARRGAGEPVLVLHGSPGGYDQGLHLGEAMFDGEFEIIAPSRPGFLRTPLDDNRSPGDQAALFVALLDELDVERALVVGLSAGGPAALQLAVEYPERVSGLILGSAVTIGLDERLYDTGDPFVDPILTSTPVLDVRSGLFAGLGRFAPDRLVELIHGELSTLDGAAFEEYVAWIRANPEHRRRSLAFVPTFLPESARIEGTLNDERWLRDLPLVDYGRVECPVLVVHGEHDAAVPISHAEFVAETVPDAELLRLDADHLSWIGPDADRAGRAVREFAASVTATASPPSG